jgi:hypothetical protein
MSPGTLTFHLGLLVLSSVGKKNQFNLLLATKIKTKTKHSLQILFLSIFV